MTEDLDLADIQGNIVRGYGRYGFPKARYFLLHISDAKAGREFIAKALGKVTNSLGWKGGENKYPGEALVEKPEVTFNIALSYQGLEALDLPTRTLRTMPAEFMDGMRERAGILGDTNESAPNNWDSIWKDNKPVHIWCSMNAQMKPDGSPVDALEQQTQWLQDQMGNGIEILSGHGRSEEKIYQEASALLIGIGDTMHATPKEHFGYVDGISDPVFVGQHPAHIMKDKVVGQGKFTLEEGWQPLATGEFLLGHTNESQEISPSAIPIEFMRNGSFMVYRKLHQNISAFDDYIKENAVAFSQIMDVPEADAEEIIKAKMVGRWSSGFPLTRVPTLEENRKLEGRLLQALSQNDEAEISALREIMTDFTFKEDKEGTRCPLSSHIRRSNTRDSLDPKDLGSSTLNKRRRIIRRGLPYGSANAGDEEHGIIFMALCTSLFRQFEFVQQQWIQYGRDFNSGNDTCPIIGTHEEDAKFVIPMDEAGDKPPFICSKIPQFVTTRGGEYFFIPSLTALRMIAMGSIDPT